MLTYRLRPAFRAALARTASTAAPVAAPSAASPYARLALLAAAGAAGGIALVLASQAESRRVWNDGPGADGRLHNYDENLKVNRHKIAAQQGKTPETPINNSKATSATHHVSKDAKGGELKELLGAPPAGEGLPQDKGQADSKGKGPAGGAGLDPAATQEQAGQEGAFNEETGEINWDCPCLGGMAHGPCGEQFRAAFSCFVFSEQEPKGIDCVEKFKGMQDCFREHPELYGEEIDDDDDISTAVASASSDAPVPTASSSPLSAPIHASPLPADHPEASSIPKKPNATPPPHSDIPRQTHLNNPAKGVQKLQPRKNRADKPEGAPPGDGSI